MSTRGVPAPYFPSPPQGYDPTYFSEVVRSFSLYIQQTQNPGTAVFNTLNLLNLPTHADNASAITGGLKNNELYKTGRGRVRGVE